MSSANVFSANRYVTRLRIFLIFLFKWWSDRYLYFSITACFFSTVENDCHRRSLIIWWQPWTWEFGSFWPFLDSGPTQRDVLNHFEIRLWMGTNWNLKIEQFDPFCFRINTFPVSKITVFFNSTSPPIPPYSENEVSSVYFKWSLVTNNQTRNWMGIWIYKE